MIDPAEKVRLHLAMLGIDSEELALAILAHPSPVAYRSHYWTLETEGSVTRLLMNGTYYATYNFTLSKVKPLPKPTL